MGNFHLFHFLLLLLIAYAVTSISAPRSRSMWSRRSRWFSRSRNKSPNYNSRSRSFGGSSFKRSSALSSSRMKYLFPTVAALGTIYIASHMRRHAHIRSYRDLERYSVCEGKRSVSENSTTKTYSYFLCPDDPSLRSATSCCYNYDSKNHYCCDPYNTCSSLKLVGMGGFKSIIGSVSGVILLIGLALVIYFCCCRNRFRRKQAIGTIIPPAVPPAAPMQPAHPGGVAYPTGTAYPTGFVYPPASVPSQNPPNPTAAPYPVGFPMNPSYPAAAAPPLVGQGWGASAVNQSQPPFDAPPPYPGIEAKIPAPGNPDTVTSTSR